MMKKAKTIMALALSVVFLASCGDKKYDIPELVKPVSSNETYQIVERGNVGKPIYKTGIVTPVKYAQFWKANVAIKEVKVRTGQKVKKGDVIAVADVEYVKENIAALERELAYINAQKAKEDEKYEMLLAEYDYRLRGANEIGDMSVVKLTETSIKIADENQYYSDLLYEHRVKYINDEISDLAEVSENENLVATHDGTVTYSLDLSKSNMANKETNIAVITDYDDTYLSVWTEENANEADFEEVYALVAGERYEIKEIEYSANEKAVLKSKKINMPKRYLFEDKSKMPALGETVYIVCKREHVNDVLFVSNDALYSDDEGAFVYIINGEKNEKRYVETGLADKHNTEIKSGLEEGEKVFTKNATALPEDYKELVTERKNFENKEECSGIIIDGYNCVVETFNSVGIIKSIESDGYKCEVGSVLCQVETSEGAASLMQQRVKMDEFEREHQDYVDMLNEQMDTLELAISEERYKRENPPMSSSDENDFENATDSDAHIKDFDKSKAYDIPEDDKVVAPIEEFRGLYYLEELTCQLEGVKLQLEISNISFDYQMGEMRRYYEKQCDNNDGSGIINVKAKADGVLKKKYVSDGDEIQSGTKLFAFGYKADPVIMYSTNGVVNSEVSFAINNEEKYTGRIIAYNGEKENYVTTLDGVVYVTAGQYDGDYVCIESSGDIANDPSANKLRAKICTTKVSGAIVIPTLAVQKEKDTLGDEYTYVWVSKDGVITKKYIQSVDFEGNSVVVDGLLEGETIIYEG